MPISCLFWKKIGQIERCYENQHLQISVFSPKTQLFNDCGCLKTNALADYWKQKTRTVDYAYEL